MEGREMINCWDYLRCNAKDSCPAFPEQGWQCWNVAGTLCRGERQGSYEDKVAQCRRTCDFYHDMMSGKILAS